MRDLMNSFLLGIMAVALCVIAYNSFFWKNNGDSNTANAVVNAVPSSVDKVDTYQSEYADSVTGNTATLEYIYLNCSWVKTDTVWNKCPDVVKKPKVKKIHPKKKDEFDTRGFEPDTVIIHDTIVEPAKDTTKSINIDNRKWNYYNELSPTPEIKVIKKRSVFWPAVVAGSGVTMIALNGRIKVNGFHGDRNTPDVPPVLEFTRTVRNETLDYVGGGLIALGGFFTVRNLILNGKDKKEEKRVTTSVTGDGLTLGISLNKKNKKTEIEF